MSYKVNLADKIEAEENAFKNLKWVFWLNIFCFLGVISTIVSVVFLIQNKENNTLLMSSLLCFGLTYVFSNLMMFMALPFLKDFNKKNIIKLIKWFNFFPIVNIGTSILIGYLFFLKNKEEKEIIKNNG
ncbi:MAG: hypothetical protein LBB95_02185 [Mycoplasmataceae bacterium]|nr:hypothetical protein [Mycoplasmataceae bacterium]